MPIYEYKCKKCDEISEYIQKFSDDPLIDCERCGTPGALEKMLSLGSFHLKGSGWYLTDYARKNIPNDTKSKETPTVEKKKTDAATKTGDTTKDKA